MITQIKEFSDISEVNKFLATHSNTKILQTKPYIIQYDEVKSTPKYIPLRKYQGKHTKICIISTTELGISLDGDNYPLFGMFNMSFNTIYIGSGFILFESDKGLIRYEKGRIYDGKKMLSTEIKRVDGKIFELGEIHAYELNQDDEYRRFGEFGSLIANEKESFITVLIDELCETPNNNYIFHEFPEFKEVLCKFVYEPNINRLME